MKPIYVIIAGVAALLALLTSTGSSQASRNTRMLNLGYMRCPQRAHQDIASGWFWERPEKCQLYHQLIQP